LRTGEKLFLTAHRWAFFIFDFFEKLSIIKIENSKEPESWRRAFWQEKLYERKN